MKKLLVLILLFIPFSVKAYDYTINKYDIYIKVNEDNSYSIAEDITANFNVQKHGIYRDIPLNSEVVRADGSKDTIYAKIKNLSVDAPYDTSITNNMYNIKIGSASSYVTGLKKYMINYTYDIYRGEKNSKFDEFYFNLIGTDWDTTISNVSFNIEMPKNFDSSKLGFSSGKYGSYSNENINYHVNGRTITGTYEGVLNPHEALIIRIPLEEGYFKKRISIEDIGVIVGIVSLIISFILWWFFGRDEKVVDVVNFYPPDNLNSLELGYMYRGRVRDKDVTSLLIYLANKGYIKIKEIKRTSILGKDDFEISKIKDYDGNNSLEKTFMEGLFKYGATVVSASSLYDRFYLTTDKLKKDVMSKENHDLIFDKAVSKKANYNLSLIIITAIFNIFLPLTLNGNAMFGIIPLFLTAFYIPFFKAVFKSKSLFAIVFVIAHSLFFFVPIFGEIFTLYPYIIPYFIITGVCLILMLIIYKYMPRRTKYGQEILGKIMGFKNFLETVNKEQLEKLVSENPEYFYDILPYTYVLDISEKWISKFETINLQAPKWYYGSEFDYLHFSHFVNHTLTDSRNFTGSSSGGSSSGSSFSSGGGFSGGGSGGGGGGSW